MFSVPKFQFPGNIHNTADSGEAFQPGLLQSGDTITDKIDIWGTRYKNGHLVIIEVICNKVKLVSYSGLADFKPLIKRGQGDSFSFVLHHYVPVMM
jgi:hypothetical protein